MPSDTKLVAAAAHTAEQAELIRLGVENAKVKLERARGDVEAAQDALDTMQAQYEEAQAVADEAREAASGIPAFVNAGTANVGVN